MKILLCNTDFFNNRNFFIKWIEEIKDEIIVYYHENELFIRSSICSHFGGEIYYDQIGILSKTKIHVLELNNEQCKITMNYKFELNGWKKILKPILKFLIPKWNETVWNEDLPLKIRRNKILKYNFKDFIGLPNNKNDRILDDEKKYKLKLPIPRPNNSTRDQHPLSNKYK